MTDSAQFFWNVLLLIFAAIALMVIVERLIIHQRKALYVRCEIAGLKLCWRVKDKDHAQKLANNISASAIKNFAVVDYFGHQIYAMHSSGRLVRVDGV